MYVCICHGVTDKQIEAKVDEGARSMREISQSLSVGKQCGKCCNCAKKILNDKLIDIVDVTEQVA
ncbi:MULTISPECIES: (2Fe-2S)-binding protein [unclassified Pseudoalteromonas]|uniref:(2Fe-2S)-binding protein n=1 Tax=unclassified Pseudoalteromonas TaxID=194690 RepID=UPI0030154C04